MLVAGLMAGLFLPGLAQSMRPWLPHMVAGLLFITAFRVGHRASIGQLRATPRVLAEVLVLQLLLPLGAFGLAWILGVGQTVAVLAVVLMLAAPSITGSPNFSLLVGRDPAPAMQVLVLGTALFPFTVLPVLALVSAEFDFADPGLAASLRMIAVILGATALGFTARAVFLPRPSEGDLARLEGAGVLALALIVIGLMAGIQPLLRGDPLALAGWLLVVFAASFGLQILTFSMLRSAGARRVPLSIVSGNRNVALFLLMLPEATIDLLLPFIGCYQLPMYLTPLVLSRLYRGPHRR